MPHSDSDRFQVVGRNISYMQAPGSLLGPLMSAGYPTMPISRDPEAAVSANLKDSTPVKGLSSCMNATSAARLFSAVNHPEVVATLFTLRNCTCDLFIEALPLYPMYALTSWTGPSLWAQSKAQCPAVTSRSGRMSQPVATVQTSFPLLSLKPQKSLTMAKRAIV